MHALAIAAYSRIAYLWEALVDIMKSSSGLPPASTFVDLHYVSHVSRMHSLV